MQLLKFNFTLGFDLVIVLVNGMQLLISMYLLLAQSCLQTNKDSFDFTNALSTIYPFIHFLGLPSEFLEPKHFCATRTNVAFLCKGSYCPPGYSPSALFPPFVVSFSWHTL